MEQTIEISQTFPERMINQRTKQQHVLQNQESIAKGINITFPIIII